MDLTQRLLRFGYPYPRPLLVVAPGGTAVRLEVERHLRDLGGALASSPGDADTLVLCGPLDGRLRDRADRVFAQLPAPRARVAVTDPSRAAESLDSATRMLHDLTAQRSQVERAADPGVRDHMAKQLQHEKNEDDGGLMMPAGLSMAERAPDRDGLKLDQLHLQLGPVLPFWPAGLAIHLVIQGDVVQQADVEVFETGAGATPQPAFWDAPVFAAPHGEFINAGTVASRIAASHLDSLCRLLAVAGWDQASAVAARLRDTLLVMEPDLDHAQVDVAKFARRVRRSRVLRWSLRDVGMSTADDAVAAGVTGPTLRAGGDAWDRLCRWLFETESALRGEWLESEGPRGPLGDKPPSAALLDLIPRLVVGADVAGVRLVVASLDPDLDQLVGVPVGVPHG